MDIPTDFSFPTYPTRTYAELTQGITNEPPTFERFTMLINEFEDIFHDIWDDERWHPAVPMRERDKFLNGIVDTALESQAFEFWLEWADGRAPLRILVPGYHAMRLCTDIDDCQLGLDVYDLNIVGYRNPAGELIIIPETSIEIPDFPRVYDVDLEDARARILEEHRAESVPSPLSDEIRNDEIIMAYGEMCEEFRQWKRDPNAGPWATYEPPSSS